MAASAQLEMASSPGEAGGAEAGPGPVADALGLLESGTVRELSRINPWASSAHVVLEYAAVLAAAWLCEAHWHPWAYALTVMFIGARQHAFGILMHDAAHFRLFRNRRLNDAVGGWLLAAPIALSFSAYRREHLAHHRHLLSDLDPDRGFFLSLPTGRAALLRDLLLHLTGMAAARRLWRDVLMTLGGMARLLVVAGILGLLALALLRFRPAAWLVLYWFIPLVTWAITSSHIRALAEHYKVDRDHVLYRDDVNYRSSLTVPSVFDRLFIVSKNTNYHVTHHLYPSVPFYRLPALHALLMRRPEYRERLCIIHGYLNVLRAFVRPREAWPAGAGSSART